MGLARQAVSRIRRSVQKTVYLTKIAIRVVIHANALALRRAKHGRKANVCGRAGLLCALAFAMCTLTKEIRPPGPATRAGQSVT
jgi:hypothetical protein